MSIVDEMVKYGLCVQPELAGEWSAYIRDNLFNEDGSECFATGSSPEEAVENCVAAINEYDWDSIGGM